MVANRTFYVLGIVTLMPNSLFFSVPLSWVGENGTKLRSLHLSLLQLPVRRIKYHLPADSEAWLYDR